jgi:hypothetical protein
MKGIGGMAGRRGWGVFIRVLMKGIRRLFMVFGGRVDW